MTFFINKSGISKVDEITYLGVKINKNLNFNESAIEKFTEVQKSVFSLSFLGLHPKSISSKLKSFIYKTY
jgi:hypothetical protein